MTYVHKTRGYVARVFLKGADVVGIDVTDPKDRGWSNRTYVSPRYFADNYA